MKPIAGESVRFVAASVLDLQVRTVFRYRVGFKMGTIEELFAFAKLHHTFPLVPKCNLGTRGMEAARRLRDRAALYNYK